MKSMGSWKPALKPVLKIKLTLDDRIGCGKLFI
jgi:hypothetical protein